MKTGIANPDITPLWEAIRRGDEVAFAAYYEQSVDRLVHALRRIVGDGEEARNIAQDTFVKLWEQREEIEQLDGFLFTAATRAALNARKRQTIHARYHAEQAAAGSEEGLAADTMILTRETELLIEEVIRRMPTQRRKVFELSRRENLTYHEIAEQLSLSPGTVHSHMKLALQELRAVLSIFLIIFLING